jgi:hypothetical protein
MLGIMLCSPTLVLSRETHRNGGGSGDDLEAWRLWSKVQMLRWHGKVRAKWQETVSPLVGCSSRELLGDG